MAVELKNMASERLSRMAYEGLYEALYLGRLVAFVGSGVSLVYGNLTWKRFKQEVIRSTRVELKRTQVEVEKRGRADQKLALQRALDALKALPDVEDAGVVFELCERAFQEMRQVGDRDASDFGKVLSDLFRSDRAFATETLIARLAIPRHQDDDAACEAFAAACREKLKGIDDNKRFYAALSRFYSRKAVKSLVAKVQDERREVLEGLIKWVWKGRASATLPVDRRSLINVFFAFASAACAEAGGDFRCQLDTALSRHFPGARRLGAATNLPLDPRPGIDPLKTLQGMNVRRFLTTNYDLELENLLMFNDVRGREKLPVDIAKLDGLPGFARDEGGRSWTRRLANGLVVRSDVYDGISTSRLFEFGIGSDHNQVQIFHLHGRADFPKTMVATDSDYNRLYREERLSRPSLDHAYDVAISGNPVLFVGLGLNEVELTRTLRNRVSNPQLHQDSPVYVLRPADGPPAKLIREQLDLFTRLGVQVIHYGHSRRGEQWSLRRTLLLIDAIAEIYGLPVKGEAADKAFRWKRQTPDSERSEREAICKEILKDGRALEHFALIDQRLEYDKQVIAWLIGEEARVSWQKMMDSIDEAARTGAGDKSALDPPRRFLAEYLEKLAEKLQTAALVYELERIGEEAGHFFKNKATTIRPRAVWAFKAGEPGEAEDAGPQAGGAEPTSDGCPPPLRYDRKYAVRHLQAFPDPPGLDDPEPPRWGVRDADGQLAELGEILNLLPQPVSCPPEDCPLFGANVVLGDRGSGKGTLLVQLADRLRGRPETLILNCSFGLEADSVVPLVADFLTGLVHPVEAVSPAPTNGAYESRRQMVRARLAALSADRKALIILGAVDRLFARDGHPLHAEFEWLLRLLLEPPLKAHILIIGSRRCERWFDDLRQDLSGGGPDLHLIRIERIDDDPQKTLMAAVGWSGKEATGRLKASLPATGAHRRAAAVAAEAIQDLRYGEVDGRGASAVQASDADVGRVAQEILKTLAFIGLPCEGEVLMIAPGVRRLLATIIDGEDAAHREKRRELFLAALDRALKRRLVLLVEPSGSKPVEPYAIATRRAAAEPVSEGETRPWPAHRNRAQYAIGTRQRFVLHRIVFMEMRNRYGLPLGETVLNSNYNLSLYASQSDEAPTLETEVATELELLADHLMNGWKDVRLAPDVQAELERVRKRCLGDEYLRDERNPDRLALLEAFDRSLRMHGSLAPAALRAAGGVIRGIFSASNILALDRDSLRNPGPGNSVVIQQKARIRRLLDTAIDLQAARLCRNERRKADVRALWEATLTRRLPAPPKADQGFLLDEPVDLIAKAQEAEESQGKYDSQLIYPLWAELAGIDDAAGRSENYFDRWPFYAEEIVWLLNERAMLSLAQGDLYSATTTFALAFQENRLLEARRYHPNRCRLLLNRALLWIERGRINDARRDVFELQEGLQREKDAVQPDSNEGRLLIAVAKGYEALCDDLQGLNERADRGYREAIRRLDGLRQQRAVAIFQFHRGALLAQQPGVADEAARCFAAAIAAAEAGRHTDIAYRVRIAKAETDRMRKVIGPADALAIHQAAREYGEQFEMHRVTVQALGASTQLRLDVGEIDVAASDCSRALALATRHGMTLSRISLRILTGRVLEKRGDSENGRFLFERAVRAAERIGYQRAVDKASSQLMQLKHRPSTPIR